MLGLGLATSKGGFVDALAEVTNTKSIIFDGGDEYIDLGTDLESWLEGDDKTLSVWVQNGGNTSEARVFNVGYADSASTGFALGIDAGTDNKPFYFLRDTSAGVLKVEFGDVMAVGSWHHFAIVQDTSENEAYVYQNGVLKTTVSNVGVVSQSTNHNAKIGKFWSATDANYFNGNVDEFALWTSALTATEIEQIYNTNKATLDLSTNTGSYSSSANLKMWLRMGDEASTRVVDTNANNLVIPDMRKTFFSGKSIGFDDSNDYIQLGSEIQLTGEFSISTWVKVDSDTFDDSGNNQILGSSSGSGYFNIYNLNRLRIQTDSATSFLGFFDSSYTMTSDTWHHIVVTRDSSNDIRVYIDGQSRLSSAVSNSGTFDFDYIARSSTSGYFGGNLCDLAIYNTELNADTITSIYNSGEPNNLLLPASYTAGSGVDKTGNLQAYYRMGNGTLDEHPLVADQTDLTLASNIVQNGDFESTIDITSSGFPNHNYVDETSDSGQDLTISTDTSNPRNGSQCMKLTLTGATSGEVNYKIEDIPAGLYKISIFARNGVSQNSAKIRLGGHTLLRSFSSTDSGSIDLTDSYQEIVAYVNFASTTTFFFAIGVNNGTDGHHILVDDFSVQKFNGNAGLMENASAFDIVDHAPNRNSGDMIHFDATADIETDTPVQIYTVANTKSVLFDGVDDRINFGDIELNGLSGLTVSAWFKANSTGASSRIVSKDQVGTEGCFILWIDGSNDLLFQAHNGTGFKIATYASFSEDTNWHHVAGVFSATAIKLYLDGVEVASATHSSTTLDDSDNEEIVIGADSDVASPDQCFKGNIDEVAIWDEALTASEVAQIYHGSQANFDLNQNGGGYTSASNLQAWWRMGDGTIDDFTLIGDQTDTSLQSNIIDNTKFFRIEDGTSGGWTKYGSNNLSVTSDSVTITHGSHTYGAKLVFKQTGANSGLTENLVVDQVYKFSCTISSLTDNNSNMKLNVTGASETSEVLSNGDAVIYFRASHATSNTFRLNGLNTGDTVTISNPSLQKVNGNAGIMKSMTSSAIETDTP